MPKSKPIPATEPAAPAKSPFAEALERAVTALSVLRRPGDFLALPPDGEPTPGALATLRLLRGLLRPDAGQVNPHAEAAARFAASVINDNAKLNLADALIPFAAAVDAGIARCLAAGIPDDDFIVPADFGPGGVLTIDPATLGLFMPQPVPFAAGLLTGLLDAHPLRLAVADPYLFAGDAGRPVVILGPMEGAKPRAFYARGPAVQATALARTKQRQKEEAVKLEDRLQRERPLAEFRNSELGQAYAKAKALEEAKRRGLIPEGADDSEPPTVRVGGERWP
jgi:hypothetical protein